MQRKHKGAIEWLEFEHLSCCRGLTHGTFLRSTPDFTLFGISRTLSCHQVHGKRVATLEELNKNSQADGLLTDEKELALLINHADCQAAIFYDPVQHALANVHCGWRGSVQNIYHETVEKLKGRFGSKPENLLVGISPSLGPEKAEFINYRTEFPPHFWPFQVKPNYFDLWEISRVQLQECGILPHHIEITELCTHSNPNDFFSYRRNHTNKRHTTFALLT